MLTVVNRYLHVVFSQFDSSTLAHDGQTKYKVVSYSLHVTSVEVLAIDLDLLYIHI